MRFFSDELRNPVQVGDLAPALLELAESDAAGHPARGGRGRAWTGTSSPASSWRPRAATRTRSRAPWRRSTRARARSTAASIPRARVRAWGSPLRGVREVLQARAKPQETAKAFVWSCMQTIRRLSHPAPRAAHAGARSRPGHRGQEADRAPEEPPPRSTTRPRRTSSRSRATRPRRRSSRCRPTTAKLLYIEVTKPKAAGHWPVDPRGQPLPRHARRPRGHADPPRAEERRRRPDRPDRLLRAARLRRRDDGPARHRPQPGLPRPPRRRRTRATSSRSSSGPRARTGRTAASA